MSTIGWLVLDAMGVIYRARDDVAELLVPYLRDNGCRLADAEIEDLYRDASLGRMTSSEFWQRCGVDGNDIEYITRHTLSPGLKGVLEDVTSRGIRVACLSNDVSEWAALQRDHFGLAEFIDPWCISGDIGIRKPDAEAYRSLLSAIGADPRECLFVDDRRENVDAARSVGLEAVLFGTRHFASLDWLRIALVGPSGIRGGWTDTSGPQSPG
ncbi:HAD family hydrolase [Candidatus Poriferisodalis sp.]|uniref:HAD family hydrolase n=1 Tax=Candidatus Poriferisodalis sp. TaxID=3101277 RepID=UPI003B51EC6E